jgi:Domain of unknown function (DUF4833)
MAPQGFAAMRVICIGSVLTGMLVSGSAHAEQTIPSVLFVSKSENKNQVHYGLHLDDSCGFAGSAPVYPYWRMLEKGPNDTEPLLEREQRAYGIERQDVQGDVVRVTLRALPNRPIGVRVLRAVDGSCTATAETTISGRAARLFNVHVALGFLHVDHLVLQGWAADGVVMRERLEQ